MREQCPFNNIECRGYLWKIAWGFCKECHSTSSFRDANPLKEPIHPDSKKVCDHTWTTSSDNAWCVKCGTLRIEAQPTSLKPEYFVLGDEMYHVSQILYLKLDGGVHGHGCWGKIQLKGMEQPVDIGDGSYQGDSRHIQHLVVGEFGFKRLRQIMRDYGIQGASR